jgi:hypothetical protein
VTEDPAFVWNAGTSQARPAGRRSDQEERRSLSGPRRPADEPDDHRTDAVLVPVDEWARILSQLGNLHQAGQQLAEARERAAKAETESIFLRERLRESRDRVQKLEHDMENAPIPEPEPLPGFGEWFVRRWLDRRRAARETAP